MYGIVLCVIHAHGFPRNLEKFDVKYKLTCIILRQFLRVQAQTRINIRLIGQANCIPIPNRIFHFPDINIFKPAEIYKLENIQRGIFALKDPIILYQLEINK